MKKFNTMLCAIFFATQIFSQTIADFENLQLAPDSFWNGSDLSGEFNSGNASFPNSYDTTYQSWSGFTYSNKRDTTTAGITNQYAAITGGGYNNSANYAIADDYGNAIIRLTGNAAGKTIRGFYITNTTYAYLSMKSGDQFAKKFGGASGADQDWLLLRVLGWSNGVLKQQAVDFYLADYRSADSTQDYILRDWRWIDLQPLGDVDSIIFNISSSDTAFGFINTPAYFAMDNFTTGDFATGLADVPDGLAFSVYPNPFCESALCHLKFTAQEPVTLLVYNGAGKMILNEQVSSATYNLPTSNWTSGIYYVKMIADNKITVRKIVKQ